MKTTEIKAIRKELAAVERGASTPGRAWRLVRQADGTISRKQLDTKKIQQQRARNWKAKNEIARLRHKLDLTQGAFAEALGISPNTLRQWEQGNRKPTGAAKTLLKIVELRPDVIAEVMAAK